VCVHIFVYGVCMESVWRERKIEKERSD